MTGIWVINPQLSSGFHSNSSDSNISSCVKLGPWILQCILRWIPMVRFYFLKWSIRGHDLCRSVRNWWQGLLKMYRDLNYPLERGQEPLIDFPAARLTWHVLSAVGESVQSPTNNRNSSKCIFKDALNDISTVCLSLNSGALQWGIHCRKAYWAALRRPKLLKKLYRSHSLKDSFEYQNFVTL